MILLGVSPVFAASLAAQLEVGGAKIDTYPFLQVHAKQTSRIDSTVRLERSEEIFVSRGGMTIAIRVSRQDALPEDLKTETFRGFAPEAALAGLKAAAGEAQLGLQRDCAMPAAAPAAEGSQEITWYGRNGRTNQLILHFGPEAAGALPSCPTAVADFVAAVERYGREVGGPFGSVPSP